MLPRRVRNLQISQNLRSSAPPGQDGPTLSYDQPRLVIFPLSCVLTVVWQHASGNRVRTKTFVRKFYPSNCGTLQSRWQILHRKAKWDQVFYDLMPSSPPSLQHKGGKGLISGNAQTNSPNPNRSGLSHMIFGRDTPAPRSTATEHPRKTTSSAIGPTYRKDDERDTHARY